MKGENMLASVSLYRVAGRSSHARVAQGLTPLFLAIQQGDWCGLHCAHRATTALSWGLCEHRTIPVASLSPSRILCFLEAFAVRIAVRARLTRDIDRKDACFEYNETHCRNHRILPDRSPHPLSRKGARRIWRRLFQRVTE